MNRDVQRYIEAARHPAGRSSARSQRATPKERRQLFEKLQALIVDLYPHAEVVISYQIPTYKAKSGWAALGYWRDGVSLYTNGPQHIEEFKAKYPAIKTGKGSINLRVTDPVPVAALKGVIRHAIERPGSP